MSRSSFLMAAVFSLVAAGIGSTAGSQSALAYACKATPHQAVGVRKLQLGAKQAARKNWSSTAASQYGVSWSVWNIAKSKSVTCAKISAGWRCLASARPCNYVVP